MSKGGLNMNNNMRLKIMKKKENAIVPTRATEGSAGLDLCACIPKDMILKSGQTVLVPTGIAIELPSKDMAAFIFARSGLATKYGITLSNGVGVVDSDYRGEICVGLRNFSANDYLIKKNERIAQMVIMPIFCLPVIEVDHLKETVRGECGFGSTGK